MNLKSLRKPLMAFALISAGYLAGVTSGPLLAFSDKIYKELTTLTQVMTLVDKQYVEPIDEKNLIQGAIQGMLETLDPYTIYMPSDTYKDFKSETTGKFGGIGIEVTLKDGILTVVSPIEDAPGYTAGIRSGDRILKIDGKSTKGMTLFDAVHSMRGPKGKKIALTIWHEGQDQPHTVTVVRDLIQMKSVKTELLGDGYVYARLTSFQEDTTRDLKKALAQAETEFAAPIRGLVLDLRDNPGGLLSQAVEVSDLFLDSGVIVSTRGRNQETEVKEAIPDNGYEKVPVVILINQGSASASEIVSGALQDTNRAKILGTTSFGKGCVQTVIDMDDNAALKVTVAKYYTPKGRSIDGIGITPDIVLDQEKLDKEFSKTPVKDRPNLIDYQKEKALEILKKS